jgi:exodeoxyribonuclease-3
MRIVTWNVNSLKVRIGQVEQLITDFGPEIICLQETKLEDKNFPVENFTNLGYKAYFFGQKTYNGVAILSKDDIVDVQFGIAGYEDSQARVISGTTQNGVRLINVYVPNGQSVDSDKYLYKLEWLKHLTQYVKDQMQIFDHLVMVGDFNIAPKNEDVYSVDKFEGQVLFTEEEKKLLGNILSLGLVDTLDSRLSASDRFTWWDYRMNSYVRGLGLRIDHIFVSRASVEGLQDARILTDFRELERPSDHAPVYIDLTV